ncbi:MAG TPA: efflux transporter outer membrane subunit [Thermoanaerobaculia bacterium]|jgi:NodT family efflux transporter outer membrane factor (OMF) lipoprotein|nr:efflux transporter outer membrane subunit [Thermoanaerobaculia bacterium]
MKRTLPLAIFATWLALGSCAVGPNYHPPTPAELQAPDGWHAPLPEGAAGGDLSTWWEQLGDPVLSQLIEDALGASPDLDLARARLREARARRDLAAAGLLPTVDASTSASASRSNGSTGEHYDAGFDASWEPDVFGGGRRSIEAATADLESVEASLGDTQVSLAAEVALNYVDVRSLQGRIENAEESLKRQSETLDLTDWRFQAGLVSQLDVDQARAAREQTRAQIPSLQTSLEAAKNRLAVLLGRAPGAVEDRLAEAAPIPRVPERVTVAIPADLLRQRPDVRAAERALAAQTARIGVAEAARYPSFRLNGSLGVGGLSLAALTGGSSLAHSLALSVAETIFDGGRIGRQIEIQRAGERQAFATYRSTVLLALEEVENALVSLARNRERQEALRLADQAAQSAADLARQRYSTGLTDFQSVLDSERTQLSTSDNLKSTEADVTTALIQLYKALGGGWSVPEGETAQPQGTHR